jgi:hypothetical protein
VLKQQKKRISRNEDYYNRFRNRKGGTIPLKKNGVVQSYQRDNNDEVVVTKLNRASLETIAKATKGGYVNGNKRGVSIR